MTVAIFMETKDNLYLVHGEGLSMATWSLLRELELKEEDSLDIVCICVADEVNWADHEMEDMAYNSVLEFKKDREATKSKQQESV